MTQLSQSDGGRTYRVTIQSDHTNRLSMLELLYATKNAASCGPSYYRWCKAQRSGAETPSYILQFFCHNQLGLSNRLVASSRLAYLSQPR